ncbi:MAG: hypothetical protein JSS49_24065 [Planctomycetes bacterium]|nr:hypothetical protein [Planctomycetota bacterium]
MARVEADREDLLTEAVALVRRMELQTPGENSIVAGFRETGWLSIYFGQDRMYQFDEIGRLRRAYIDGLLYRTHGTVLAQLERQRTEQETALVRRDLSGADLAEFRSTMLARINSLLDRLTTGHYTILRQIPDQSTSLAPEIGEFLQLVVNSPEFLAAPIRR